MTASTGPLEGLLVADFSRVLAGPFAAMTLGDLGADVIKVERPGGGDDTRAWGPPWRDGESTYYLGLNRNKRSVALDLGDDADRELARELAARADVLIESFRPGLMASWGLDGDTLRREGNPRLVSCSITAFGSSERAAGLPGYDLLLQAMGGLMSVTGEAEGQPVKVGAAVVDLVCGLLAVAGIEAALVERERTGEGRHVEISLLDSVLTSLLNQGSGWVSAEALPGRRGNRHPSIAPYETYNAADRPFAVAAGNDRLFARLCEAIGLGDLPTDERFASNTGRVEHIAELGEALEAVFTTEPAAHWVEVLREANVPVGPINDVAEAYAMAEELGLEPILEADGVPLARPPVGTLRRRPPRLDEHGDEIRAWLKRPVVKNTEDLCYMATQRRFEGGTPRATGSAFKLPKGAKQTVFDAMISTSIANIKLVEEKYRATGAAGALVYSGRGEFVSEADIWAGKLKTGAAMQVWADKSAYELLVRGEFTDAKGKTRAITKKDANFRGTSYVFLRYEGANNEKIVVRHHSGVEVHAKSDWAVWIAANPTGP